MVGKQRRTFFTVFLFSFVFAAFNSSAQTPLPIATEQNIINSLPEPVESQSSGLMIDRSNAQEFKNLIIHEFYPRVRANLLQLDTVRHLRADLSAFAKDLSGGGKATLQPDGSIQEGFRPTKEIVFSDLDPNTNPNAYAQKLLWNVQARLWSSPLTDQDFSLSWVLEQGVSKKVSGHYSRIYPSILNANDKFIQLFRERINVTLPPALKGLSFLTFRFLGNEEDMYWIASPSVGKVRLLTGTNRSDGLLGSSFSADDISVWSGKLENTDVVFSKVVTAFVPFADTNVKTLKASSPNCLQLSESDTDTKSSRWNFESKRFPQAMPWLPTNVIFTPRKLLRVELISRDPFSMYARQILYVDTELFIPYYKFVYNRSGYLWKTVIGAYQPTTTPKNDKRYLLNRFVIVEDMLKAEAHILENSQQTICEDYSPTIHFEDFDPQKLVQSIPKLVATAKPQVSNQESEDISSDD